MIVATIAGLALGFQALPKSVTPLSLKDSRGIDRKIPTSAKGTVLVFVATECPIANRMAPELARIVMDYKSRGIKFFFVYADPGLTNVQINRHLTEFKFGAPGIYDSQHRLVKSVGATVTPQSVLLSNSGEVMYRGRVDDLFVEHGRSRKEAKNKDLRNAIDDFLAGRKIRIKETPALGCAIPPIG